MNDIGLVSLTVKVKNKFSAPKKWKIKMVREADKGVLVGIFRDFKEVLAFLSCNLVTLMVMFLYEKHVTYFFATRAKQCDYSRFLFIIFSQGY